MKSKKWLTYAVGILLTLVVLTAVAGAGFRAGTMQNTSFARPVFTRNFEGAPQAMQGNFQEDGNPHAVQGNFDRQKFDRRDGGMSFFSPIFGLIRFVVLGLLLWVGYKFVKKSGWRLSRVQVSSAPTVSPTSSVEGEEKKESE